MCQEVNWGYGHKAQPFPCVGDPRLCVSSHENPGTSESGSGVAGVPISTSGTSESGSGVGDSPSPPLAPQSQQHGIGVGSHLQLLSETDRRGGSTLYLVRSHKLLAVLTRSKSLPLVLLFLPCKPDEFSLKMHGDSSLKLVHFFLPGCGVSSEG